MHVRYFHRKSIHRMNDEKNQFRRQTIWTIFFNNSKTNIRIQIFEFETNIHVCTNFNIYVYFCIQIEKNVVINIFEFKIDYKKFYFHRSFNVKFDDEATISNFDFLIVRYNNETNHLIRSNEHNWCHVWKICSHDSKFEITISTKHQIWKTTTCWQTILKKWLRINRSTSNVRIIHATKQLNKRWKLKFLS